MFMVLLRNISERGRDSTYLLAGKRHAGSCFK